MATRHFGMIASSQIKSYIPNKLPLLLIISRARSTNEVSTVIQGECTSSGFISMGEGAEKFDHVLESKSSQELLRTYSYK